jgi:hypothetical protein
VDCVIVTSNPFDVSKQNPAKIGRFRQSSQTVSLWPHDQGFGNDEKAYTTPA